VLDRRGDPTLQLPVDLPVEGLTDEQFLESLKHWEEMMNGFVGFLTRKPVAAARTVPDPVAAS
jgi:hypothetical protein